jgi:hypothetical protein
VGAPIERISHPARTDSGAGTNFTHHLDAASRCAGIDETGCMSIGHPYRRARFIYWFRPVVAVICTRDPARQWLATREPLNATHVDKGNL